MEAHVLIILAEERVGRRLAEDRAETLQGELNEARKELADMTQERDSLHSEKRILLADVAELRERVEKGKEGRADVAE